MDWLFYLVVGMVAAALGRIVIAGNTRLNWISTMLVGAIGGVFAGQGGVWLGLYPAEAMSPAVLAAVMGGLVLLAIVHLATRGGPASEAR